MGEMCHYLHQRGVVQSQHQCGRYSASEYITLSWSSQKTYRPVNIVSPVRIEICALKTLELTLPSEEITGSFVQHWPGSLILCFMTPVNWPRNIDAKAGL